MIMKTNRGWYMNKFQIILMLLFLCTIFNTDCIVLLPSQMMNSFTVQGNYNVYENVYGKIQIHITQNRDLLLHKIQPDINVSITH